jgi:hypothetical protein
MAFTERITSLQPYDRADLSLLLDRVFSPPPPTPQQRWQLPKGVGGIPTDPIATEGSSGLLVHDRTRCDAP